MYAVDNSKTVIIPAYGGDFDLFLCLDAAKCENKKKFASGTVLEIDPIATTTIWAGGETVVIITGYGLSANDQFVLTKTSGSSAACWNVNSEFSVDLLDRNTVRVRIPSAKSVCDGDTFDTFYKFGSQPVVKLNHTMTIHQSTISLTRTVFAVPRSGLDCSVAVTQK